jgi:predicted ribosomally synthesized peptide with SipW-like signal peptide
LRRRRWNGLKKIGLLALALVLALGSLGVAYAAWTDSVYVQGTVNTGNLDIDVLAVSSTFAYKVPGALAPDPPVEGVVVYKDTVVRYVDSSVDPEPYTSETDPPGYLVASAVTAFDNGDDEDWGTMAFSGLFPCADFQADMYLRYNGTVPGIVNVAVIYPNDTGDTLLTALWNLGKETKGTGSPEGIWIDGSINRNDGNGFVKIDEPEGLQLHRLDRVHVTLHAHLPEGTDYENLSLGFTGIIDVIQWNMYGVEE